MSLRVPATVLLLLLAGCGGGGQRQSQEKARAHSTPRTVTEPAPPPKTVTAEAEAPATSASQPQPALAAPTAAGPWTNCGRIRSPVDDRPARVEARVFDCRAARRVAVRYLRDGSLPHGWTPNDCAASRAACEQGGWAFRVVRE